MLFSALSELQDPIKLLIRPFRRQKTPAALIIHPEIQTFHSSFPSIFLFHCSLPNLTPLFRLHVTLNWRGGAHIYPTYAFDTRLRQLVPPLCKSLSKSLQNVFSGEKFVSYE